MTFGGKKATALLFFGDIAIFTCSLWLTLLLRYRALPDVPLLVTHLRAFAGLFVVWLFVFYFAGLYGKRAVLFKSEQPSRILRAQIINVVLAALFFFLVPQLGIAPKTNLFIYLVVSLIVIFTWRLWLYPRITLPSFRESAALIGEGPEVDELVAEVNGNPRYHLCFRVIATPSDVVNNFEHFAQELQNAKVMFVVADLENEALRSALPKIYDLVFAKRSFQISTVHDVYEDVFDRVPLSLLRYDWFLEHLSRESSGFYDALKRIIDIVGGIAMGLITIVVTPLVFFALLIESPGPTFIKQERFGRQGIRTTAYKFRSMTFNDAASGAWVGEGQNRVTRVGAFLRKTSLDEFPQFINVLRGELSLIGPRNDTTGLGARLSEAIPYYNARYTVKPGITGWAQINQQYEQGHISPQSIEETKTRLAYDFYYIKHRSFALDILIALRTVKRMFFRVSSL